MKNLLQEHYDSLIDENNDPIGDTQMLQKYTNMWDVDELVEALRLNRTMSVLEIGVGIGRHDLATKIGIDLAKYNNIFDDYAFTFSINKTEMLYVLPVSEVF